MRFSTRNTHKRGKAIALATSAAILGIGGTVSYISQKDVAAETSSKVNAIYYARKADFNSANAAAAKAKEILGSENAALCSELGGVGGEVTRLNPHTNEDDTYWIFAKDSSSCPSSEDISGDILLNDNGATVLNKTYDDTFMASTYQNSIGALGAFHIIGFEQIDHLGAQTNGNILTPNLINAESYIGYFEKPTISYAHVIGTGITSSFSFANSQDNNTNVLVTGPNTAVGTDDNGERWTINGHKANMPQRIIDGKYADNLWQEDTDTFEFLDIPALKTSGEKYSQELSDYSNSLQGCLSNDCEYDTPDYDFSDQNNLYINIPASSKDKMNVINLDKQFLVGSHDIKVTGFDQHTNGILLINVDLAGETDFEINNSFDLCYADENYIKYEESISSGCLNRTWIHDKYENHVILNLYDSTANNGNYQGDINISRETTAVILAPDAKLKITASTIQGIMIANEIGSIADTYYLSLNDNLPLVKQDFVCTITINHYLEGTDTKIAETESVETICDHSQKTVKAATTFLDSEKSYTLTSAKYAEDNNTNITSQLPLDTINDLPTKTYNLYYNELCTYVINHVNYFDNETVYGSQSSTVTCNTPVEVGHDQRIIDQGHAPVDSYGNRVWIVTSIANNVNGHPTTFTLYYKDPLHLVVDHEWITGTHIKTDEIETDYYIGDEYDTSSYILKKGLGDDEYDYQGYEVKVGSDSTSGQFADKDIHVTYVYTPMRYGLTVNHYWEDDLDTPFKTDHDATNYTKNAYYNATRYIIESDQDFKYASHYLKDDSDPIDGYFNDGKNKVVNIVYTKEPENPETCTIYIHHYKKDTKEPVDDDISMTHTCDNIQMQLEISKKALENGYKFVSGRLDSERYVDEYTEEDLPRLISNNFPEKTYTLYYEMPDTPETPETPNTLDKNPAFAFSAAGAVIGLGTAIMLLARRRQ